MNSRSFWTIVWKHLWLYHSYWDPISILCFNKNISVSVKEVIKSVSQTDLIYLISELEKLHNLKFKILKSPVYFLLQLDFECQVFNVVTILWTLLYMHAIQIKQRAWASNKSHAVKQNEIWKIIIEFVITWTLSFHYTPTLTPHLGWQMDGH